MDPVYVQALETRTSPELSRSGLFRLATALETTVDALTGARIEAPPGRSDPTGRPLLEALGLAECADLLRPGGIGRVVFVEARGPAALPVNFRMLDGSVVFRTMLNVALDSALGAGPISFEVDHIDEALIEGWSVLVTGWGHLVVDANELERVRELAIAPWAGGDRDVYVRIVPTIHTGRRIRRG
jgi:nitroimidazol reductase NimA-like FMN-containing flavoprotein (pyridoxamine 5'-phosphate oxidase superfamily)